MELFMLFEFFIELWALIGDPGAVVVIDASGVTLETTSLVSNSIDIGATEPIIKPVDGVLEPFGPPFEHP